MQKRAMKKDPGVKRRCSTPLSETAGASSSSSGGGGIIAQPMTVDLDSRMRRNSRISGASVNEELRR